MKPHKGYISNYKFIPVMDGEGCVVFGKIHGHPVFKNWIRTSILVGKTGDEIETLNSRYTLVGECKGGSIILG